MTRRGDEPKDKRSMTVKAAGQKGGEAVAEKYDHEHFEEIGRLGGEKVRNLIERKNKPEDRR